MTVETCLDGQAQRGPLSYDKWPIVRSHRDEQYRGVALPVYVELVDAIARQIASGELRPGTRLPTQRQFARKHRVALSTVTRAYAELTRRGLVVGEVGRGTFVRDPAAGPASFWEPSNSAIDLEFNFSVVPGQLELMSGSLRRLSELLAGPQRIAPNSTSGTPEAREAAARLLARPGWKPVPRDILFTGSGRQAIGAAFAALAPRGGRIAVEELTYPVVKLLASRMGIELVPLPVDAAGVDPGALSFARREAPLHALYVQPSLHNPLGVALSTERREQLARIAHDRELTIIEDAAFTFLHPSPPFVRLLPERTVFLDSLSKRLAPGLTLGYLSAPHHLAESIAAAIRSGGWTAPRFAMEAATAWVDDGTIAIVERQKREDATKRQRLAAKRLAGFDLQAHPHAYHVWWRLPDGWRADMFVAAAARAGISVTPAATFAVGPMAIPEAVRMTFGSPSRDDLDRALTTLARLAASPPELAGATE